MCWWCVVSGLYSQGWEDGDRMLALPIELSASTLRSMETAVEWALVHILSLIHI